LSTTSEYLAQAASVVCALSPRADPVHAIGGRLSDVARVVNQASRVLGLGQMSSHAWRPRLNLKESDRLVVRSILKENSMKKTLRGKLTYSNVISTLCLFLLLGGGTALAASQMLPKNSVGAKQLKKAAVTPAKLSTAAKTTLTGPAGPSGAKGSPGAQGPKGDMGERGEPGSPATTLFAQITREGTVNASGSPVTVENFGTGLYWVNFGRDITHCAVIANEGSIPDFEVPGSATIGVPGYGVEVEMRSAGGSFGSGFPTAQSVTVTTFHETTEANNPFYIAVFC
jgi:hypothetical protein